MKYLPENKEELKELLSDKNINLADINTSLITDMSYLFYNSTRNDFSGLNSWDTSKVESFEGMFCKASNFNELISFDTSKATNLNKMFFACENLNQALILDVKNANDISEMFYGCESLNNKIIFKNSENIQNASMLFKNCKKLNVKIDYHFANLLNADEMFSYCYDLNQEIRLIAPKLKSANAMFSYCINLNNDVYIKSDELTEVKELFSYCYEMNAKIRLEIDFDKLLYVSFMFLYCKNLRSVDIAFRDDVDFYTVFKCCDKLDEKIIKILNSNMYYKINNFEGYKRDDIDAKTLIKLRNDNKVSKIYSHKIEYIDGLVYLANTDENLLNMEFKNNCFVPKNKDELSKLIYEFNADLNTIDVSNIQDFSYLFANNSHNNFDFKGLKGWDTSNAINMEGMFLNCFNFNQKITFNTKNVKNYKQMFAGCKNLSKVPILDTKNAENMQFMFNNCPRIRVDFIDIKSVILWGSGDLNRTKIEYKIPKNTIIKAKND